MAFRLESNAIRSRNSALAELETLTGLLVAVFLPLDHSGVSGEEVGVSEEREEVGAMFGDGSGQAEEDRSGLTVLARTFDVDEDVESLAHLGDLERGSDVAPLCFLGEVLINFQLVDQKLAGAFDDPDAGDGGLASAGAPDVGIDYSRHREFDPQPDRVSRSLCQ